MALAWVTGAAGFIGTALARHLAASGHRVAGIGGTPAPDMLAQGMDWAPGLISEAALDRLLARTGMPDVIHHLAGGSSVGVSIDRPGEDFERTVTGSARLLEWLRTRECKAPVVVASSAAVYGVGHPGPIPVDAPANPCSPYGRHKQIMELLFRSYAESFGVKAVIARLFSVYGPGLRKQLLWDLCGKFAGQGSVTLGGTGAELRDWIHIDDVVRLLADSAPSASVAVPVVNGGTGIATSVRDVAAAMVAALGGNAGAISFSGLSRPGDPFCLVAATAPGAFDCQVPFAQGVAGYAAWYRSVSAAA